jgi:hypothetical protein
MKCRASAPSAATVAILHESGASEPMLAACATLPFTDALDHRRGSAKGCGDRPSLSRPRFPQTGFCLRICNYPKYSGEQFNRRSVVLEIPGTIRSPSAPKVDNVIPGLSTSILEPRPPFHVFDFLKELLSG